MSHKNMRSPFDYSLKGDFDLCSGIFLLKKGRKDHE